MSNPNDEFAPKCAKVLTPLGIVVNPIDELTGAIIVIDSADNFINLGETFYLFNSVTIPGTSTVWVQFKTGSKELHLKRSLNNTSTNNIRYTTYENPTITDGTAVIPTFNAKRDSSIVSTSVWYSNPTAVSAGLKLHEIFLPGSNLIRSTEQAIFKIVYKANTTYAVKIENLEANNALFYYSYYWHEI